LNTPKEFYLEYPTRLRHVNGKKGANLNTPKESLSKLNQLIGNKGGVGKKGANLNTHKESLSKLNQLIGKKGALVRKGLNR